MRKGQPAVQSVLEPGERKCARCSAIHPATTEFFNQKPRGLSRLCIPCETGRPTVAIPPCTQSLIEPSIIVDYTRQCVIQTTPFRFFRHGKPLAKTLEIMQYAGFHVEVLK